MMREVPLGRIEELLLRVAHELRPTLAISNSPVLFSDRGHFDSFFAACLHFACPTEHVCVSAPGFHAPARSSPPVVDTFPNRCRWQARHRKEPESSFAGDCP
jgi:hypothetical protein